MRKFLFAICLLLGFGAQAQIVNITGDVSSNTTWTANNIYQLDSGFHYVTGNSTLTIEPGTLIIGRKGSLVVTRGSKLHAVGTSARPIVFTSSKPAGSRAPGDWGGVLLLGNAPINDPAGFRLAEGGIDPVKGQYGGTDVNDNSGNLQYVRIEFAGIAYQPNNETNGLTCGGVGLGTTIDHVQVSFGGDDAFEWFGGTVNAKHLITYRGVDDEFDTDYGFTGRLQFCLSVRDSSFGDVSGSNGFESDNDAGGSTNGPITKAIISNFTIVGPKRTLGTTVYTNYKRAAHLKRTTSQCLYNSILMGYPTGLKIEGQNTWNNAATGTLQWRNNILAGCPTPYDTTGLTTGPTTYFLPWYNANGNSTLTNVSDLMLADAYDWISPDYQPMPGSPALSGASFTAPNLNNPFFEQTTYRGAFDGTTDWTDCWANWDPQNTPYTTPGIDNMPLAVAANDTTTFCAGGSVDLTATSTGTNYVWSNGATTPSITVGTTGSYAVTVSNTSGCVAVSQPITVTVNQLPVPAWYATGIFPTMIFVNYTGGTNTYSWDFGDGNTSTAQSPSHSYAAQGSYNVCLTVTSPEGCVADSCLNVSVSTAVAPSAVSGLSLSPNPASELVNLDFALEYSSVVELSLSTINGQTVMTQSLDLNAGAQRIPVNVSQLPAGIYLAKLVANGSSHTLRVAVMR
ncbi:MAG: hypothetical protein RLZZ519_388 [Bacteroidota bacterium]|jgi:hypothetical protein